MPELALAPIRPQACREATLPKAQAMKSQEVVVVAVVLKSQEVVADCYFHLAQGRPVDQTMGMMAAQLLLGRH